MQAMRDDQRAHGELEAINPTPASDRIDRLTGPRRKGQGGHAQPSTELVCTVHINPTRARQASGPIECRALPRRGRQSRGARVVKKLRE